LISVVIPTITGRENSLARTIAAYNFTTNAKIEWLIYKDRPTCGIAWNEGIAEATGDYIHLSADDLEPQPGWYEAAWSKINHGFLPAPRILKPDGTLESCGWDDQERPDGTPEEFSRIPFAPKEWFWEMGPMLETHYMGDYYFGALGRRIGILTVIARDYLFIHHHEMTGRLNTLKSDWNEYERALRTL